MSSVEVSGNRKPFFGNIDSKSVTETLTNYGPRAALLFAVPFVAQLGFGAGVGVSAQRAALIGASGLIADGVVKATLNTTGYRSPTAEATGQFLAPLIAGAIYTGGQSFIDIQSQGMEKNFVFSSLSVAAANGLSYSAAPIFTRMLADVRSQNQE